jgi:hypothetical protein
MRRIDPRLPERIHLNFDLTPGDFEMTDTNPSDLIDHKMMQDHQDAVNALAAKLSAANEALRAEQAIHTVAARNYQQAVSGGVGNKHETRAALDAATTRLLVEQEAAAAAAAAFDAEENRRLIVRALAHKPLFEHGIAGRMAAARAADAARAALQQAEEDYKASTQVIRAAMTSGLSDVHDATDGPNIMKTEAEERTLWSARNIDADAPKHPWMPE